MLITFYWCYISRTQTHFVTCLLYWRTTLFSKYNCVMYISLRIFFFKFLIFPHSATIFRFTPPKQLRSRHNESLFPSFYFIFEQKSIHSIIIPMNKFKLFVQQPREWRKYFLKPMKWGKELSNILFIFRHRFNKTKNKF